MKHVIVLLLALGLAGCTHIPTELTLKQNDVLTRAQDNNKANSEELNKYKVDPLVTQRRAELGADLDKTIPDALTHVAAGEATITEFREQLQEQTRKDDAAVAAYKYDLEAQIRHNELSNQDLEGAKKTQLDLAKRINGEK